MNKIRGPLQQVMVKVSDSWLNVLCISANLAAAAAPHLKCRAFALGVAFGSGHAPLPNWPLGFTTAFMRGEEAGTSLGECPWQGPRMAMLISLLLEHVADEPPVSPELLARPSLQLLN